MAARRLTAILAALLTLGAVACAQLPNFGGNQNSGDPVAPDSLRSPRATMETFLTAMNAGDVAKARTALDLSEIESIVREEEGSRLAASLMDVINRTAFVDSRKVPDRLEGAPWTFHSYDRGRYAVTIARQADGAWRFTAETVAEIDALFEFVREEGWAVKTDPATGERLKSVDLLQANPAAWLKERFPESMLVPYFGIGLYNYLAILGLVAVAFVAGALIRLATRLVVRSSLHIDEEIADKRKLRRLGRALSLIVNVALIGAGMPFLELPFYVTGPTLFVLKLLSAVGWLWLLSLVWDVSVAAVALKASERRRTTHRVVVPVVSKFGRFLIFVGVLVFFIASLGYNVSALLAGLGIGGLVVALAAKDSVENIFGSITILMEMPFGVGDWVKIGDVDGEVEEINLRSTRIRTSQDSLITLPNSRMITSHVENFGARRRRRLNTVLGVAYDTPPEKIQAFCSNVRAMLERHPKIWDGERLVYLKDLGESTLDVAVYCYIEAQSWQEELEARDDVMRRILQVAAEMGVEFAFPTRTIVHPPSPSPTETG